MKPRIAKFVLLATFSVNAFSGDPEDKDLRFWEADWGSDIRATAQTTPCPIVSFKNQGYQYSLSVTIPLSRLRKRSDAHEIKGDRAETVQGCWFKKEDGLAHAKMTRKRDKKTWEQDLNFNDGSWNKHEPCAYLDKCSKLYPLQEMENHVPLKATSTSAVTESSSEGVGHTPAEMLPYINQEGAARKALHNDHGNAEYEYVDARVTYRFEHNISKGFIGLMVENKSDKTITIDPKNIKIATSVDTSSPCALGHLSFFGAAMGTLAVHVEPHQKDGFILNGCSTSAPYLIRTPIAGISLDGITIFEGTRDVTGKMELPEGYLGIELASTIKEVKQRIPISCVDGKNGSTEIQCSYQGSASKSIEYGLPKKTKEILLTFVNDKLIGIWVEFGESSPYGSPGFSDHLSLSEYAYGPPEVSSEHIVGTTHTYRWENPKVIYTIMRRSGTSLYGTPYDNYADQIRLKTDAAPISGPPAADVGSTTDAASAAVQEQAYLKGLTQAIARNRFYPPEAQRGNVTGVVLVSFTIQADGALEDVRVAKGSGSEVIDEAAMETVRRLGRYKPIPAGIGRSRWAVKVAIHFDMR